MIFETDFKDFAIKGRSAQGNILTKNDIHKITLKEEGISTLGGRKIWFDKDVFRLNADSRGDFLGEFSGEDKILILTKSGYCRLSNFDLSNHYEEDILLIEKFEPSKIFTVMHYDAEQEFSYLKRFQVDDSTKEQSFISESDGSYMIDYTYDKFPQVKLIFGGKHESREDEIIDAEEFIAVKSIKARGKRLSTYDLDKIRFDEPLQKEEEIEEVPEAEIKTVETSPKEKPSDNNDDKPMNSGTQMSLEI